MTTIDNSGNIHGAHGRFAGHVGAPNDDLSGTLAASPGPRRGLRFASDPDSKFPAWELVLDADGEVVSCSEPGVVACVGWCDPFGRPNAGFTHAEVLADPDLARGMAPSLYDERGDAFSLTAECGRFEEVCLDAPDVLLSSEDTGVRAEPPHSPLP